MTPDEAAQLLNLNKDDPLRELSFARSLADDGIRKDPTLDAQTRESRLKLLIDAFDVLKKYHTQILHNVLNLVFLNDFKVAVDALITGGETNPKTIVLAVRKQFRSTLESNQAVSNELFSKAGNYINTEGYDEYLYPLVTNALKAHRAQQRAAQQQAMLANIAAAAAAKQAAAAAAVVASPPVAAPVNALTPDAQKIQDAETLVKEIEEVGAEVIAEDDPGARYELYGRLRELIKKWEVIENDIPNTP